MGRPRLPTELKRLKGTLVKIRENPDEPSLKSIPVPAPPDHLTDLERHFWVRLKAVTDPLGVYYESDIEGFEMMVRQRSLYEEAMKQDPRDLKAILNLSKDVQTYFQKFGLTPQARAGVKKLAPKEPTDEVDAFFAN